MTATQKPRRKKGAGGIQQLARGRWRGYKTFDGKRRYVSGTSRADVESKLAALQPPSADGRTLADAVEGFLDSRDLGIKTRASYEQALRLYLPGLAEKEVAVIETRTISAHYRAMASRGLSASTIATTHAVLRGGFGYAHGNGWTVSNASLGVQLPRPPAKKVTGIHEDDLIKIEKEVERDTDGLRARWLLALRLGLRPGEACGLRVSDIDWEDGSIAIRGQVQRCVAVVDGKTVGNTYLDKPKSSKGKRRLYPGERIMSALRAYIDRTEHIRRDREIAGEWRARQADLERRLVAARKAGLIPAPPSPKAPLPLPNDLVFFSPRPRWVGSALTLDADAAAWYRLLDRAGVEKTRRYAARHGVATRLLGRADGIAVAATLGHADPSFTYRRYADELDELTRVIAEHIDD